MEEDVENNESLIDKVARILATTTPTQMKNNVLIIDFEDESGESSEEDKDEFKVFYRRIDNPKQITIIQTHSNDEQNEFSENGTTFNPDSARELAKLLMLLADEAEKH